LALPNAGCPHHAVALGPHGAIQPTGHAAESHETILAVIGPIVVDGGDPSGQNVGHERQRQAVLGTVSGVLGRVKGDGGAIFHLAP